MRIAYISTGAAGMYCGTCIHDNTLASALIRQGHEVVLVPTYTPTRTDEENVSLDQMFFGGVNLYLQHKSALFRRAPRFLQRLLDSPKLLEAASRRKGSTRAEDLGSMTVDMLLGEQGSFKRELERLTSWLADDFRPDLVELNLCFFLGMARTLRRELGVPVVCAVQGEDIFINQLEEPYKGRVIAELRARARDVDGYISPSRYYVQAMGEMLDVPEEMFHIVPLGIRLQGHGAAAVERVSEGRPFTVGYLARICPEKGLHLLAEAFRLLTEKAGRNKVRLRAAGWLGEWDRPFFESVQQQLREWGLEERWEYAGELDRPAKIEFLRSVDVLCVPTVYREPKGLFALEAMANSVPVVLPAHGSFPEMIEATQGGILVEPDSAEAVAEGLERLMLNPALRASLGRQGRLAVVEKLGDDAMAVETLRAYDRISRRGAETRRGGGRGGREGRGEGNEGAEGE